MENRSVYKSIDVRFGRLANFSRDFGHSTHVGGPARSVTVRGAGRNHASGVKMPQVRGTTVSIGKYARDSDAPHNGATGHGRGACRCALDKLKTHDPLEWMTHTLT